MLILTYPGMGRTFKTMNKTIKQKIFISYVILLIIPFSIFIMFNYVKSKEILEAKSVQQFETVTRVVNQQFDQYFIDIENLSINILVSPVVQDFLRSPSISLNEWTTIQIQEQKRINQFLNGIFNLKPGISSIRIHGFNDRYSFYHPTRRWDHTFDGSKEEWFEKTIDMDGRWMLTGKREERQLFHTLQPEPEEVVTFSRMIKDLETLKPIGVLAINIDIHTLKDLAGISHFPSELKIVDKEGFSIIQTDDRYVNLRDDELLKVSSQSPFTEWTTVYITPKHELLTETRQFRNLMLIVAITLTLCALVIANKISIDIVKPLRKLQRKMQEVEKGDFSTYLRPEKWDEIGDLTHRFNTMVEHIRDLVTEIRQQEKKKMEIELSAMQARINPHFMYNTLNGIRWVALIEGNHKLAEMIASFVHLLKFSSKNKDLLITIESETELLCHYVQLMKMRNDQFTFDMKVDEGIKEHMIIPFILQPIVENSIFHGIVPSKRQGEISVELFVENNTNIAVITDNGVGMNEEVIKQLFSVNSDQNNTNYSRIGLKNVYDRLKLQFGSQAMIQVTSELNKKTDVRIEWPVIKKTESSKAGGTT